MSGEFTENTKGMLTSHNSSALAESLTSSAICCIRSLCYIIFIKFFLLIIPMFWFCSRHLLHFVLIILPHVTLSTFILISGFKCFSIVPNFYMRSHLLFHMLSPFFPCALTPFTTFSKLLWHFIFLWLTFITLPIYPNAVYKPMYLPSSSSVCKLMLIPLLSYLLSLLPPLLLSLQPLLQGMLQPSDWPSSLSLLYLLKSLSSLSSLSSSSGNYIFTKMKLWPSNLMSQLTSRLLTNSRTTV